MAKRRMQLSNLTYDSEIYPRGHVDDSHVSRMRDSYRAGWVPPPLLVDQKGVLIDGVHRYKMYELEEDPEFKVDVDQRHYKTKGERIEDAFRLIEPGKGRDGKDFDRAIYLLQKEGYSVQRIAVVVGHTPDFVEKRRVRVALVNNEPLPVGLAFSPRKGERPKRMTTAQYEIAQEAKGWASVAQELHRLIDNLRADNIRFDPNVIALFWRLDDEIQARVPPRVTA